MSSRAMALTAARWMVRPATIFPPCGTARRSMVWMHSEQPPAEKRVRLVPYRALARSIASAMGPLASYRLSVSGISVVSSRRRSPIRSSGEAIPLWPGICIGTRPRARCRSSALSKGEADIFIPPSA